jgi:hypothetical protein
MKENEDFKFRPDITDTDFIPIELLVDEFKGVVYHYKNMGMGAKEEDGSALIKFEYVLLNDLEPTVFGNDRFERYIGLILNYLILMLAEIENTNEPRENDPIESDTQ